MSAVTTTTPSNTSAAVTRSASATTSTQAASPIAATAATGLTSRRAARNEQATPATLKERSGTRSSTLPISSDPVGVVNHQLSATYAHTTPTIAHRGPNDAASTTTPRNARAADARSASSTRHSEVTI